MFQIIWHHKILKHILYEVLLLKTNFKNSRIFPKLVLKILWPNFFHIIYFLIKIQPLLAFLIIDHILFSSIFFSKFSLSWSSSRIFINTFPNSFLPLPFPPSPQNLSLAVCSLNSFIPVDKSNFFKASF